MQRGQRSGSRKVIVSKPNVRQLVMIVLGVLPLLALDQFSKRLAITQLKGTPGVAFIPGYWDFQYVENRESAFNLTGWIPETIRTPLIVAVSLTTLAVIAWYVLAAPRRPLMLAAFTAIATGAVGNNLLDRLMYGFVVDFIHWHIGDTFDWPVFNVADSLVVVGVGLLLLDTWLTRDDVPAESSPVNQPQELGAP